MTDPTPPAREIRAIRDRHTPPKRRASDAVALASRRGTVLLRATCGVAVAAVVAAIVMPDRSSSGSDSVVVTSELDLLHLAAAMLPLVIVSIAAHVDVHRRRTWSLLGAALTMFPLRMLAEWQFGSVGTPRVADVVHLGGTALLVIASALVTRNVNPASLRSDRLDGMILVLGGSAAAAMMWSGSFRGAGDTYEVRVAMGALFVDLLLATVLASAVSAMRYRPSPSVLALCVAAAGLAAADVGVLLWVADHPGMAFRQGAVPDWIVDMRLAAATILALSVWLPRSNRRQRPERLSQLSVIPVVFSLMALGILGAGIVGTVNLVSSLLALAAVAAVILRTAVTVHELHTGSESYRLARTDELTSLTNRRGFLEGMDRLIQVAPGTVAVMIVDLNGFKEVNDSLGHHAGDELLRLVADRFRPVVGDAALLARLGGDEFGVVIMVPDDEAALAGAGLLQRSLDEAFMVDGISVRVGAAIGVALYPSHSRTRSGVLRSADVAMYDAKQRRTGVEMYHPASDFQTREKLQLLEDLRQAIEHRGLSLHYQPKVDLRSGKIASSEALVRWQHPTRGLMYPDDFVPVAERAGLVPGLTRAVLAQAISFHAERCPHVGVSVNISHRDVVDDNLAEYIADLLEIYAYPAEKLTLEITETELAHDPDRASRSIAHLRSAGMRISIDDFGVGYSSMARLLDLEVDEVKIDKSFVFAISDDVRAIAIIRSTVELAAALGLQVVAEGIENAQVLAQVLRAGVDVGQGYVITRPLDGKDYLEFLQARTKGVVDAPKRPPVLPPTPRPLPRPVLD